MLDRRVVNLVDKIKELQSQTDKIINDIDYNGSWENNEVYKHLEHLSQTLDEYAYDIEYYRYDTTEDILKYNYDTLRFEAFKDSLSCGYPVEICYEDEWIKGRIEASDKYKTEENESGYYFYNEDCNRKLEVDLKVRKRNRI